MRNLAAAQHLGVMQIVPCVRTHPDSWTCQTLGRGCIFFFIKAPQALITGKAIFKYYNFCLKL